MMTELDRRKAFAKKARRFFLLTSYVANGFVLAIAIYLSVVFPLRNPDMTPTRIFLETLPVSVVLFVLMVYSVFIKVSCDRSSYWPFWWWVWRAMPENPGVE